MEFPTYQFDRSISVFRGGLVIFFIVIQILKNPSVIKSSDPDQTPHFALGLRYLSMSHKRTLGLNGLKQ